jgi:hypothetical protein
MSAQPSLDDLVQRPSRVIAEALVARQGPTQITARAAALGLPRQLTQVILAACTATATDTTPRFQRKAVATS